VSATDRAYVSNLRKEGRQFSPYNRAKRSSLYGSPALKKSRQQDQKGDNNKSQNNILTPWERIMQNPKAATATSGTPNQLLLEWKKKLDKSPSMAAQFLEEYHLLKQIAEDAASKFDLIPLRNNWEDVFTTRCPQKEPCACCRNCNIRIAQGAIVVFAAQGVADENILPHLGAVFRHPRYQHFGVEEWAALPIAELASLLNHCSMQGQNALYIHDFLAEVGKNGVPRTLEDCLCFLGILKKTACLFLTAVFGKQFGIPVDRHLAQAFINCGWVHPNCKPQTSYCTMMSDMVELWLPMEETGAVNNVVAGLRQLYQNSRFRLALVEAAAKCGPNHLALLKKTTQDLLDRSKKKNNSNKKKKGNGKSSPFSVGG
jgi:endonuclease III